MSLSQAIDAQVKQHIEEETAKALASTPPDYGELANDIYITDKPLTIRSCNAFNRLSHATNA